jgi:hypothetical protein
MDANNNAQQPSDNEESSDSESSDSEMEVEPVEPGFSSSSDESGANSSDSGWGDEDALAEVHALGQELKQLEEAPAPLQLVIVDGNAPGAANIHNALAQFVLINDTDNERYTDGSSSHTAHTSSEMDTDTDSD